MEKKSGKMSYVLTEALVWMGALQAALWGMKWLLLPLFPDTRVAYKLFTMGCMLLLTATLLIFSYFAKPRQREHISMKDAFIIGLAQACAVMPGLSRSGSTIATGLLLGNKKESLAQFSFLMVIPPILGEALLDVLKMVKGDDAFGDISALPLVVGFVAAFVSGCVACKWMINIVKKGKLVWFGVYCAIAGAVTIICSLL